MNYEKTKAYRKAHRKYLYTLQRTWKLVHKDRVNELHREGYHRRKLKSKTG